MKVKEFEIPDNLYYSREHEWSLIESPNRIRVGITDYAQKTLHEIVFVATLDEGSLVERSKTIGTAESVKAVSEIYSPVSGMIITVNKELEMSPELVNQDPYGKGWIIIIEPLKLEKELNGLLKSAEYAKHVESLLSN